MTDVVDIDAEVVRFPLTDDFNPIDIRDFWLKEQLRRGILGTIHPDILL